MGALVINGPPVDLTAQVKDGFALLLDWRIDRQSSAPLPVSFGGAVLDLRRAVSDAPVGTPLQTRLPLRCFADAGANLAAVGSPLRIAAAKGFAVTIRNVRIEATTTKSRARQNPLTERERTDGVASRHGNVEYFFGDCIDCKHTYDSGAIRTICPHKGYGRNAAMG